MFQSSEDLSRAKLGDALRHLDHEPRGIYSMLREQNTTGSTLLVEVDGYVDPEGDIIGKVLEKMDAADGYGACIGGYPVPPVYNDKVGKNAVLKAPAEKAS